MAREESITPLNRGPQPKERFSISLSSDTKARLKEEAEQDGMSLNELVEQAIELELYVRDEKAKDSEFFIQRSDDKTFKKLPL
jgi:hypothetical protein